ncbi:MAG: hypothetical protein QNJ45_22590 [Ardenticatenaceae bacterium]|nr:hypothetical protein [Ardenticatenaceae bacterium]
MDRPAESQQYVFDLDQAEMLGLMAAVQTTLIVGIDNEHLVPDGEEAQREMALAGLEQLKAKGWLTESEEEEGLLLFDANLGMMAPALAYPETMVIVTRDEPGKEQRQFLYYRNNPVHLALEIPADNQYRLIAIQDAITMLNEVRSNLPVTEEPEIEIDSFSLPLEAFMTGKNLAEQGNIDEAANHFVSFGCSPTGAKALAEAIRRPTFGGTITFLQLENQEVVDGRNLVVVKNDAAAWMVQPREDNPELLQVQTATPADYSEVLLADTRAVI